MFSALSRFTAHPILKNALVSNLLSWVVDISYILPIRSTRQAKRIQYSILPALELRNLIGGFDQLQQGT